MNTKALHTDDLNGTTPVNLREVWRCEHRHERAGLLSYTTTGKEGHRFTDGMAGVELSATYDVGHGPVETRLWVFQDGTFAED